MPVIGYREYVRLLKAEQELLALKVQHAADREPAAKAKYYLQLAMTITERTDDGEQSSGITRKTNSRTD